MQTSTAHSSEQEPEPAPGVDLQQLVNEVAQAESALKKKQTACRREQRGVTSAMRKVTACKLALTKALGDCPQDIHGGVLVMYHKIDDSCRDVVISPWGLQHALSELARESVKAEDEQAHAIARMEIRSSLVALHEKRKAPPHR